MIDFSQIPDGWAVCGNESCKQAEACLRRQAYLSAAQHADSARCLLPRAWSDEPCRYFVTADKVLTAVGFEKLFARLTSRDARMAVRLQLTELLGSKGSYYRYKHGERQLTEEQQRLVEQVFRQNGYDGPFEYDRHIEAYHFKNAVE